MLQQIVFFSSAFLSDEIHYVLYEKNLHNIGFKCFPFLCTEDRVKEGAARIEVFTQGLTLQTEE